VIKEHFEIDLDELAIERVPNEIGSDQCQTAHPKQNQLNDGGLASW
jgi:hypothetical protein